MRKLVALFLLVLGFFGSIAFGQWKPAGYPPNGDGGLIYDILVCGDNLFCTTLDAGVFRSANNGLTWSPANAGLTSHQLIKLASFGTILFAFAKPSDGVFRSLDSGTTWSRTSRFAGDTGITSITATDNALFIGYKVNGYAQPNLRSLDSGTSWTKVTFPVTIMTVGTSLFGYNDQGLYRSNDKSETWTKIVSDLPYLKNTDFSSIQMSNDTTLYVGYRASPDSSGIYVSNNNGESWTRFTSLPKINISCLSVCKDHLIVFDNDRLENLVSVDNGYSWGKVSDLSGFGIGPIVSTGNYFFGATVNKGILCSADGMGSWQKANSGLTARNTYGLAEYDNMIFAGSDYAGLFRSSDNGGTWKVISIENTTAQNVIAQAIAGIGNSLFVGCGNSIYTSGDTGATWSYVRSFSHPDIGYCCVKTNVTSFCVVGNRLCAGTRGAGVFLSIDTGRTWDTTTGPPGYRQITAFAANKEYTFASSFGDGVWRSADSGISWVPIKSGLTNAEVYSLGINDKYLFAGTSNGVFRTSNNGISWAAANNGLLASRFAQSIAVDGDNLFMGTGSGVYYSTNSGDSWSPGITGFPNGSAINSLLIKDNKLYAATGNNFVWYRPLSEMVTTTKLHQEGSQSISTARIRFQKQNHSKLLLLYASPSCIANLTIFTLSGKQVLSMMNNPQESGEHVFTIDAKAIPSGNYLYRIKYKGFAVCGHLPLFK
jgi:photosystem II stability/assembly factor-like uncharacterized protein